jgi:hypothetical protein|tara:strand:- start:1706 stop:3322 length:1617 start_codon:yes stop_codon:yes gene_type:complete
VAVVSISRIQIRRGRKNQGLGLPQLASGELGWAVDAQELWIGNGAVSEGSPYVGNTKMLTEHDDLFAFAKTYAYKSTSNNYQTGVSVNAPVQRTLQDRLDDRVSIRTFGANGDGLDQTAAIQRALDQLYLNAATKLTASSRVVLYLEAGDYTISNTINVPPFASIVGAGIDKTIITCTGATTTAFTTVNDSSQPGVYALDATSTTLNQARGINISGLTIQTAGGTCLELQSCKDSTFTDIKLKGPWASEASINGGSGVLLKSLSTAVNCIGNKFYNIRVQGYTNGVKADHDIKDNAWEHCDFKTCRQGFDFGSATVLGTGGMDTGPVSNNIANSTFNDISRHAIEVQTGNNNVSISNKFYDCGNVMGSSATATHSVIKFTAYRNQSHNDWFKRTEELGYDPTYIVNNPYVPEIEGTAISEIGTTYKLAVGSYGEYSKLFRLPADTTRAYEIDYVYISSAVSAQRTGKFEILVNPTTNLVTLTDSYDFIGDSNLAQNLKFKAQNYDEDSNSSVDTVAIMVLNSTNSDNAVLTYKVKIKS